MLSHLPTFTTEESRSIKNVIILATPSLAHALERVDFLQMIVAKIYSASDMAPSQVPNFSASEIEVKSVAAVAAVVDALPYNETLEGRQRDAEGLSILFSSGSVYSEPALPELTGDDNANYTFTFVSRSNAPDSSSDLDIGRPLGFEYLTLPVANTFFVNGSRATLIEDLWKVVLKRSMTEANEEDDQVVPHISHEKRKDLQSATIDAAFQCDAIGQSVLPLTRLTEGRAITKAMGNVVTEIQTQEAKVPASTELESSVSEYIKRNPVATSAGPLLIYASIVPASGPLSDRLPSLPFQLHSLMETEKRCTRLFRVTGGGGGWGKKQGLLSLDPTVDFDGENTISSFPNIDDADDVGHLSEPKGMMPLGSIIQFWVFNNDSTPLHEDQRLDLDWMFGRSSMDQEKNGTNKTYFALGTGPRAEEREGIEGQERQVLNQSKIQQQYVHGYFGMLAYGGAAVGTLDALEKRAGGAPTLYAGTRSRVDVPNTTFMLNFEPSTFTHPPIAQDVPEGKTSKRT